MGIKLREVREAKGLSQEELAKMADVSRTTIWSLETNPNAQTTTKTLIKIADALGTTVGDIFFCGRCTVNCTRHKKRPPCGNTEVKEELDNICSSIIPQENHYCQ